MGYQVESYSLNELHRIAVPGAVAPSLFWALPVGRWDHGELDRVWRCFTEHPDDCNDFGLLLVKEMGRLEREGANVSLASVGAKLSDLMPAGTERFLHPRDRDGGESAKVLVLSGGYRHAEIWSAIEERMPTYRPSSPKRDWDEEVRRMTLGSAKMILSALGPLAFSGQAENVSEFVTDLGKLTNALNAASHDREGEPVSSDWTSEVPALIRQLLVKAEALLGDLPWHMEASFVYGDQPKVLSGEAWSHGSPTPRLLRVIVWSGSSPGKHVTFWNKERRNPVVPDPVFIVRPRKRREPERDG